ncbi:hypothetical protein KC850_01140 [Candidatus Kaiserbacteria bacterium]|nr:hypothetical protein [Candidatus Kaiserbacteria bacterium]MCB9817912.1 hypothetical protein [Candidatus Nomurabacteria bacterium]
MSYGPRRTTVGHTRAKQDLEAVERRVAEYNQREKNRLDAEKQSRNKALKNFVNGNIGTEGFKQAVNRYKKEGVMTFTPTLPE